MADQATATTTSETPQPRQPQLQNSGSKPPKPKQKNHSSKRDGGGSGGKAQKLRGLEKDSPEVRLSKTVSWLLRHAAAAEGLEVRKDGYVRVDDLVKNSRLQPLGLTLEKLQEIVKADSKQRYTLICEQEDGTATSSASASEGKGVWLVKANQGHTMKTVQLDLKPITSTADIPSGIAVHGTTNRAWEVIQKEGLSKMKRNHIHLAQGVGGDNIISGMRRSSQILIFINIQKAIDAGIKFYLSDNGVVLTEGDEKGYLNPEFFERVENAKGLTLQGGRETGEIQNEAAAISSV